MTIRYTDEFITLLKKKNVRIRKSFKEAIAIFSVDPDNSALHNHSLRKEWTGYKSIDITSDYRAVFKEVVFSDEVIVYFTTIGTHKELYDS